MRDEKGRFVKGSTLGFQKGHKIRLGMKHTEESIKKMSESTSGKNHPMFGKHHSEETKLKISLANLGHEVSDETRIKIGLSGMGREVSKENKERARQRWVGKNNPNFDKHLYGEDSPHWQGGLTLNNGYIMIYQPNHPYTDKAGYIREHRLVMEKFLGRYLEPAEVVHHINGIKDDNRIENLMLFDNQSKHTEFHQLENIS